MKKLALAVLASMAVWASPASAGVTWPWNFSDCGGNAFSTCMSGTLAYSSGILTLTITNTGLQVPGPANSTLVFTQVGLINVLPAGSTVGSGSAPTGWTWGATPLGGAGLGSTNPASKRTVWGYDGPGGNGGLLVGQTGVFTFNVSTLTASQLANIGVGIHAQAGPGGCSTKFGLLRSGPIQNAGVGVEPCVSVPEPNSMALLATGLAGLAFVAARRRNGLELIDENGNDVAI